MSKKSKKKKVEKDDPNFRTICKNRKARHLYDLLEELECGIALTGSEVKSIRNGKISIDEAYAQLEGGELWLVGCDIAEYPQATVMNHHPRRKRKLLIKKRELVKFAEASTQKGLTLVPVRAYFTRGIVKIKIAIGKGRKIHDHRENMKKNSDARVMRQAMLKNR